MGEMINTYNFCAKNIEKSFNKLGCMPFGVPIFSGQLRMLAGAVQKAVAAPFFLLGAIGYAVTHAAHSPFHVRNHFKNMMLWGAENFIHGGLNIIRGAIEVTVSLVSLPLLGFGSLALAPFNYVQPEPFAPIFAYGSFTGRKVVYIPMPYGLPSAAMVY